MRLSQLQGPRYSPVTPASPSARSRTTFCVRASQATARSVEYIERRADLARKTKRAPDHVFLWRASRAFQVDFTGLSRMALMRLPQSCARGSDLLDVEMTHPEPGQANGPAFISDREVHFGSRQMSDFSKLLG
jgi:hypothetical protein